MSLTIKKVRVLLVFVAVSAAASQPARAQAQDLFEQAVIEAQSESEQAATREEVEARINDTYFSGRFIVDDADPIKSVPSVEERNANPIDFGYFLTSLFTKGQAASQRGDHAAAAKYFLALAAGTPAGAMAFRQLCAEYRALGKVREAQQACGTALSRNGVTVDDSVQFLQLVVTQPEELSKDQVADADAVIDHLSAQGAQRALVQDLKCRLGARVLDVTRLQACTDELRRLNYPEQQMSTYVWALAMLRGDSSEAKRQLALAEKAGADSGALASMARATDRAGVSSLQLMRVAAVALIALLLGVVAFACRSQLRRRARMQW